MALPDTEVHITAHTEVHITAHAAQQHCQIQRYRYEVNTLRHCQIQRYRYEVNTSWRCQIQRYTLQPIQRYTLQPMRHNNTARYSGTGMRSTLRGPCMPHRKLYRVQVSEHCTAHSAHRRGPQKDHQTVEPFARWLLGLCCYLCFL